VSGQATRYPRTLRHHYDAYHAQQVDLDAVSPASSFDGNGGYGGGGISGWGGESQY
jgi:hypothetical protein